MAFYYDTNVAITTNATALTETDHLRYLTVANQETAALTGLYGTMRSGTAGGASLRVKTFGVASTVGTAQTPAKRHPSYPAAGTTAFTLPTAGSTPTVRLSVGMAQTGGMGGWIAIEPNAAIRMLANGGANGNADVFSIANAASVAADFTAEHSEG